ncbi:MAG: hypothetical protein KY394_06680, partial [Actinobacteria bacterium]|nr:hypothetical protein [Actinomycetota bacterium]
MEDELSPARPAEEGVPEETPDLAQIEPAHILANDARDELRAQGFTDEQIHKWAETYVAEQGGTADIDRFLDWIAAQ